MVMASGTSGADSFCGGSFCAHTAMAQLRATKKIARCNNLLVISSLNIAETRCIALITQRLTGFQRVLDPLLCFLLSAKRLEAFALQVENVLLAHRRARGNMSSAKH